MPFRLLCDECIGSAIVQRIADAVMHRADPPVLKNLVAEISQGVSDEDWIPRFAKEGWTILTADRGRRRPPKLPDICLKHRITHILLGSSLHRLPGQAKAEKIIGLWDVIEDTAQAPRQNLWVERIATPQLGRGWFLEADGRLESGTARS